MRYTSSIDRPGFRPERMVCMKFGTDFFRILNIVIQLMRMFAKVFGDDEDKAAAAESEARTKNTSVEEAC